MSSLARRNSRITPGCETFIIPIFLKILGTGLPDKNNKNDSLESNSQVNYSKYTSSLTKQNSLCPNIFVEMLNNENNLPQNKHELFWLRKSELWHIYTLMSNKTARGCKKGNAK